MKTIKRYSIYSFTLAMLSLVGCVGQVEPEVAASNEPKVTTDMPYANIDKGESVSLRVLQNGALVTNGEVEVFLVDENNEEVLLHDLVFTPSNVGDYHFKAVYKDLDFGQELVVKAYDNSQVTNNFFRRHLIHKFTATWCTNCPPMGEAIHKVSEGLPLQIIEVATHCNELEEAAELEIAAGAQLDALFAVKGRYPTIVTDYNVATKTTSSNATSLKTSLADVEATYPTVGGVKIASTLAGKELTVTVSATVQEANDYRIGVLLVQDNYAFTQYGAASDYKQNYVLRGYLTAIEGDELGVLAASDEVTRAYTTRIEDSALKAECRIVAFLYNKLADGSYVVNNATQCTIGNTVPYLYEFK